MDKKQKLVIKINILALLMIGIAMLYPSMENTHAETVNRARSTDKSSVSIAIDARIDLEITPSATGALNHTTTNLAISTSQSDGFRVLVNSDDSTLRRTAHPAEPGIYSIATATALSALPNNTWGIYFGASNPTVSSIFLPVTTTQTELIHNEVANASGTYKFAIGAKADTSLPAGYYSSQLVFSVIAEAPAITSLADATYMQDVTPEICSNSDLEVSYTLIDRRDDKSYKVAKLKDGNCWMQENLAIDLTTGKPLTSNDSDITPNEDGSTKSWLLEDTDNRIWEYNGYRYYNWDIATAGSGKAILNQDSITTSNNAAPDSICTKGWKLPLSGTNNNNVSGSFQNMVKWYGGALYAAPVNFTRVGFFEANGVLQVYGKDVYYWSRNAWEYGSEYIYNCYYGTQGSGIEPSNRNAYTKAFSVRCVMTSTE